MTLEFQIEWGWLTATDFFFGGIGAGLFLLALYLDYKKFKSLAKMSALLGPIFVICGVIALAIELGHPERFILVFSELGTSWISRGSVFNTVFILFGLGYALSGYKAFSWLPWTQETMLGKVIGAIAGISAVLVAMYPGFVLATSTGIPFWVSPMIPLLFITYALVTGTAVSLLLPLLVKVSAEDLPKVIKTQSSTAFSLSSIAAVLLALSLAIFSKSTEEIAASANALISGWLSTNFWGLVVVIGLAIPLLTSYYAYSTKNLNTAKTALLITGLLTLIGGYVLRYVILAAGIYPTLF